MTSNARVHATLNREPVDRIPVWMWLHPSVTARLATDLRIPAARVADALGDDIRQTWVGNNHAMEGIVHERDGQGHTDAWGIEWVREGGFNQVRRSPLAGLDESAEFSHAYPYDQTDELMKQMEPVAAAGGDRFIGCDISPCLLEMVFRLRGMEQTLLDLAGAPERSAWMLRQAADFSLHLAREACRRFSLDWLWTGDDVAGQQSMILSPRQWRASVRPLLAEIIQVGKDRGLRVAYHSCGAVRPIIPDLIEIGVDVLNPVQTTCPGMEAAGLARDFGPQLAFMGGVDTQRLLPFGSSRDVHDETRRLIDTMTARGGAYILGASHAVPPETPIENVFAMYAAAGISAEEIRDRASTIRSQTGEAPAR